MFTQDLAKMIDHTLLKTDTTLVMINKLCEEAKNYNFISVCVNPYWVSIAAKNLIGTNVKVCTVIGFPLGASTKEVKTFEAKKAIEDGASEIDMVINIGALKSHQYNIVEEDIEAIVEVANGLALVKVIIETCLLTEDEKILACRLIKKSGADFVKTSTGFNKGGATYEDVKLMRNTVGPDMGVKASGGIRDYEGAMKMIGAGANRIGTSSGIEIVKKAELHTNQNLT